LLRATNGHLFDEIRQIRDEVRHVRVACSLQIPTTMRLQLLVVFLVSLASTLAHAEPLRSRATASVGIGMPEGEVGIEYAFAPHRNVEIAVSGGLANLIASGEERRPLPQIAIMPRGRYDYGRVTLMLGAGLSEGRYHEGPFGFSESDFLTRALWANGEGSAQVAIAAGWSAGIRIGVGRMIAHSKVEDLQHGGLTQDCSQFTMASGNDCTPAWDGVLPYLGLVVGKAF
jgi:hypothetical protein